MRATLAPFLFVLCITHAAAAAAAPAPAAPAPARRYGMHIRPLTPSAIDLVLRAAERSAIVRAQLEDLEKSDVVVYVVDSAFDSDSLTPARIEFVAFAAGTRYLIIRIERWRLSPWEAVARFGHELHHALEIASAPEVRSAAQMGGLYKRIGWECGSRQYESDGARTTTERIRDELTRITW